VRKVTVRLAAVLLPFLVLLLIEAVLRMAGAMKEPFLFPTFFNYVFRKPFRKPTSR